MGRWRSSPVLARIGWPLAAVGGIIAIALLAPLIAPQDPVAMDVANRLASPSSRHWLGQDEFGRDVLSRLIWGARASLAVAILSALMAGIIGVLLGLVGGYFGGIADLLTIRLTDIILSFPPILLALLIVTLAGPGTLTLILVLSLLYAPGYARVTYGEVLSARQLEYVEAARASGAHPLRILLNTVLPNVAPPILVQFSLTVAGAILIESGLSFLGLGVVPPTPSWGLMIRGARATMEQNWLLLAWPSLALIITILAINRLCDALRDAFDPRLAGLARDAPAPRGPSAIPAARDATPAAAAMPAAAPSDGALLAVDTLRTYLTTPGGIVKAVDGVSLTIRRGETVALVGESGSGKSMTGLSILGLMPKPAGRIVDGSILLTGRDGRRRDLARLGEPELQAIRGNEIAMIFQEPMTSLNPVYRVGWQIEEAVLRHQGVTRAEARKLAVGMLDAVGIPDAARRARAFPHELSGGMRQRAMIAMALSSNPSLLIADEPTTALDVTIQAEILDLLRALQADEGRRLGLLFVTHNLGVVAEIADKVLVMYAGRIVEEADTRTLFRNPRHPYTIGLLASMPAAGSADVPSRERPPLEAIPGQVPSPLDMPSGCAFAPRCAFAEPACAAAMPELRPVAPGHSSRCRRWHEIGVGVKETA